MAFYTMNLGFDISSNSHTQNGDFLKDDPSMPLLQRSKVVLTSTAPPDQPSATFSLEGSDTNLVVAKDDEIWIRVFSYQPVDNLHVRITAVFGRLAPTSPQTLRSPFSIGKPHHLVCRAVFDSESGPPNFNGSWLFGMGAITDPAATANSQYGYTVGATVWQGKVVYTFGHDPDMEVSSTPVPVSHAAEA